MRKYDEYIASGGKIERRGLRKFASEFIQYWLKKRGEGHYKTINDIIYMLFSHDLPRNMPHEEKAKYVETKYTLSYIANYIAEILIAFSREAPKKPIKTLLKEYLDKVFIQIVDIYGFVSIYYVLLDILYDNYDVLTPNEKTLFKMIKHIFIKYMYSPCVKPISLEDLLKDLERITNLFDEYGDSNELGDLRENHGYSKIFHKTPKNSSQIILRKKNKPRRIKNPILLKK
jgi:hypothetical protein